MADTAAHLVDHVLPVAPYRQWTLSLPHDIRLLVIRNPDLLGRVLQLFLRAVFTYQRRRARLDGITDPMPGAVTMLQFWGSVLQLTPHAHSWLPDGVFHTDDHQRLLFHRLTPPTDEDVEALLLRIERRVRVAVEEYEEPYPDDEARVMASTQLEASRPPLYTIPLEEHERPYKPRCAFRNGFSLHADLDCHQRERPKLERLLRYGLRPPFAQKRLSLLPDGKVRLKLRKPFYTGQTDVVFEPVEFLRRLASAVPKPMQNMIRYHGISVRGFLRNPCGVKPKFRRQRKAPRGPADPDAGCSSTATSRHTRREQEARSASIQASLDGPARAGLRPRPLLPGLPRSDEGHPGRRGSRGHRENSHPPGPAHGPAAPGSGPGPARG